MTERITDDAQAFRYMVETGKKLMDAHLGYEQATPYPLQKAWTPGVERSYRVEKMVLKNRRTLIVNESLTLKSIPLFTHDYILGNRSALEWVIDQYQVTIDERSGIVSDPNRPDDPEYIVRLVCQVVTISVRTVELVNDLGDSVNLDDFNLHGVVDEGEMRDYWKQ
jgi:predicted helicase